MKNKICKTKTRKITYDIKEEYELLLENGAYGIVCTEYNKIESNIRKEEVKNITTNKRLAKKLYSLLVKNKACVGTIKDIIDDQMCWKSEQPLKKAVFSFMLLQFYFFYCIIYNAFL